MSNIGASAASLSGGGSTLTAADFYKPAMMQFDGSTASYEDTTVTSSGNKVTGVVRFARSAFTGNRVEHLVRYTGAAAKSRVSVFVVSSDFSTAAYQNRLVVRAENSAGVQIANLTSITNLLDGNSHTLFYEFDGDAGTASFIVDGNDEDDTGSAVRIAPTTGTLDSGASSEAYLGESGSAITPLYFSGQAGFFGLRDVGGLTWSDFMDANGNPKPLDESTWTEWGSQPLLWHEAGKMDENLGSTGAMTKNGTITLASAQ